MGGTRLTVEIARSMRRPLLVVDLMLAPQPEEDITDWLLRAKPPVLNVTGPRESGAPGIGRQVRQILRTALSDYVEELGFSPVASRSDPSIRVGSASHL